MIRGTTRLLPLFGDPVAPVKAPMIYNPYFARHGIDAVVVPMGVAAGDYAVALAAMFRMTNVLGAIVTMPHKRRTSELVDALAPRARAAGSCNAVVRTADGKLLGDLFDGLGFVNALARNRFQVTGARCLVVGAGGVGSAIALALAAAGAYQLAICDIAVGHAEAVVARLRHHHPHIASAPGPNDPAGFDLVVNASPLGMSPHDPLPVDVSRLAPTTFVAEVVMKPDVTPLLAAARQRACRTQPGVDMLFEQIPMYLEFFGLGQASSDELRAVARLT